jgi:hypothetical protein
MCITCMWLSGYDTVQFKAGVGIPNFHFWSITLPVLVLILIQKIFVDLNIFQNVIKMFKKHLF